MNSFTVTFIGLILAVVAVTARHHHGININGIICLRQGDIVVNSLGMKCVCSPTNQQFLGIKILRWNCSQTTNTTTTTTTTMVPTMVPTTGLPVAPTTMSPPTPSPTAAPTGAPTAAPTAAPTGAPTAAPTAGPTEPIPTQPEP